MTIVVSFHSLGEEDRLTVERSSRCGSCTHERDDLQEFDDVEEEEFDF